MAKVFADFQIGVAERIQDGASKLASDALDNCVREALTGRYSQARPLIRVADKTGDSSTFKWALVTANFPGWVQDFSAVREVEYPAGERVPAILAKDEWAVYWPDSTAPELRLTSITPQTGKTVRVRYTAPHAEDGSDTPDQDFYGVANLAASLAASLLAAYYSQQGDASFGSDAVDHRSKADQYRTLARDLMKRFEAHFGMDKDTTQPAAGSTMSWEPPLLEGSDRLTH